MTILYLHGLHSRPGGIKPTFLKDRGYEVVNPALPDDDFAASVAIARTAYDESRSDVVVGSSRGGAVAIHLDAGTTPLVLIAPAWRRWGTADRVKAGTVILHAEADGVIPILDSRALLEASGLPETSLIVVGRDHNMVDEAAFRALVDAIESAASGRSRDDLRPPHVPIRRARGLLAVLPLYFLEGWIGQDQPPAITHPEYFYGFLGVGVSWQVAFLVIARDPMRFRPLMIPAVLEKATYGGAVVVLFALGRVSVPILVTGLFDTTLGVLFFVAFLSASPGRRGTPISSREARPDDR